MSSLIIYNNNVAYTLPSNFEKLNLGDSYSFQIGKQEILSPAFSVDRKIHDILSSQITNKPYDVIFLPYSLSEENYLEFVGLRFAYHIRLTQEFNNIQTPIVFYGFESAVTINKLSELGLILFTKYVYQTEKITAEDFKKQIEFVQKQKNESTIADNILDSEFLNSFVSKIRITASGNYNHHHSVINEWSIYRWAKTLKIEDESIRKIEKNIGSNLYFKYLLAKYPIKAAEEFQLPAILNKGKILYIDDELEKGWDSIFKVVCKGQTYSPFGKEFKNWDTDTILSTTIAKIKEYDPDVVVLDFRLHDDDFETANIADVTGFKILKEIKENINPGIQVIIFSATNKIWNLQELQKAGADDFILKESPELSADAEYSKFTIEKLALSLSNAFEMSFLKKVNVKINEIVSAITIGATEEESEFRIRLENNLEITFKLLTETKYSAKYFNYAYLQLFQIIEDFSNLSYVFREGSDSYVCVNGKEVLVQKSLNDKLESAISYEGFRYKLMPNTIHINPKDNKRRLETNFKISAILTFRLGFEDLSKWVDINNIRNKKAAHFNVKDSLNEKAIFAILDFITIFISPAKQNENNINKGLKGNL